jgi:hypothetical protein
MAEIPKNGGPAFPEGESWVSTDISGNQTSHDHGVLRRGMTLRDWFTGQALQGCIAHSGGQQPIFTGVQGCVAYYAKLAYAYADAMLAEREHGNG